MKVSIVIATYNRADYMDRALACYAEQTFTDFELIYVDDHSEDDTLSLLKKWSDCINISVYSAPPKPKGLWRSEASIINPAIKSAKGELVILSHPEIMPGNESIRNLYENKRDWAFLTCKTYFLSLNQQACLDDVAWENSRLETRKLPHFYDENVLINAADDVLSHANIEKLSYYGSWQFAGFTRDTWNRFGPLTQFNEWGSVDIDWLNRRDILGIGNYTAMDAESYVVHQNHDSLDGHNRNMEAAIKALPDYPTRDSAIRSWDTIGDYVPHG